MTQKKVDNSSYKTKIKIGASGPKQILWFGCNAFFFLNPFNPFSGIKVFMLRIFGAQIGKGVVIKPSVNIKYPWKLSVGDNTWIGENVWIDNLCQVLIGENVCISQGALLLTGSHDHTKTSFDFIASEIILEDGVWIGARAVVAGGVTCRSHSILGVNSIAESDLQPYFIYKGNPAIAVLKRNIF
jgi:putative colanic acid biosynthesis acetyltransferase WcaF